MVKRANPSFSIIYRKGGFLMFIAIDETGRQITADEAKKSKKYFCPVCDAPVTFKSGNIKLQHFSHHRILDCTRYLYKKESIRHLEAKHDLYLKINGRLPVSMEYYLSEIEQIPDLLVDGKLAVEIQLSKISQDLIVERSKGYRELGIDVVWILDEAELKMVNGFLFPTHFQISTMYKSSIFTYDMDSKQLFRRVLRNHHGCGKWQFSKIEVEAASLIHLREIKIESKDKLSNEEMWQMVQREKLQKSVLNPTLSFIYQLSLDERNLPEHLRWTVAAERWILNPPLEWKLFIYHGLEMGSFNWDQFERFIRMRKVHGIPPKLMVLQELLKSYYLLYNSR